MSGSMHDGLAAIAAKINTPEAGVVANEGKIASVEGDALPLSLAFETNTGVVEVLLEVSPDAKAKEKTPRSEGRGGAQHRQGKQRSGGNQNHRKQSGQMRTPQFGGAVVETVAQVQVARVKKAEIPLDLGISWDDEKEKICLNLAGTPFGSIVVCLEKSKSRPGAHASVLRFAPKGDEWSEYNVTLTGWVSRDKSQLLAISNSPWGGLTLCIKQSNREQGAYAHFI